MKIIESLTKKGSVYLPENISENLNQFDILILCYILAFWVITYWFIIVWILFRN